VIGQGSSIFSAWRTSRPRFASAFRLYPRQRTWKMQHHILHARETTTLAHVCYDGATPATSFYETADAGGNKCIFHKHFSQSCSLILFPALLLVQLCVRLSLGNTTQGFPPFNPFLFFPNSRLHAHSMAHYFPADRDASRLL